MFKMFMADRRLQSWSPDGSITGATVTGFTTPAYTQVDDTPPAQNAKQKTVTALTGTQGSATANSASSPFTETFYKPQILRGLPPANPVTGLRGQIPTNQWKLVVRKGCNSAAGVPGSIIGRLTIDVPAGVETYNPDEIKAFVSYLVGLLNEESADLADTILTGVL
jgi:hypothetical protein